MLKIVLDTNAFISCIGKKSTYRNVFDALLENKIQLYISSEILLEYEEKFIEKWGIEVTENLFSLLLSLDNVMYKEIFFDFNLVFLDSDDNKFVNTFIASNSDFIVSNDKQILQLNKNEFPQIVVITLQEFSESL
jgi:putative PIN family toxin of toxin-antitoxin system